MKIAKDLAWSYVSVAVMAISGMLLNIVIAFFYDSSALGVFNETYAWYMILSQITVWGIHMSVLKYVPEQDGVEKKRNILKSAIVATILVCICVIAISEMILITFHSIEWRRSLQVALIGLYFFSMNKVLLNYLNAIYELVTFSIFQSLRYLGLVGAILLLSVNNVHQDFLSLAFPMAEGLTFFLIVFFLLSRNEMQGNFNIRIVKDIFAFGTKILPSNMIAEMNTKVDVVSLGFLVKDTTQIGVYSFAILFTEGFYMIYMTVRKIINPGISESNANGKLKEYVANVGGILKIFSTPVSFVAYILILMVYYFICRILVGGEYEVGIFYIAIICMAIAINGKSIIWGDFLSQIGYPLEESKVNVLTVLSNIVFNVGLILAFGVWGAALATGISHFIYGVLMQKIVKRETGIRYK